MEKDDIGITLAPSLKEPINYSFEEIHISSNGIASLIEPPLTLQLQKDTIYEDEDNDMKDQLRRIANEILMENNENYIVEIVENYQKFSTTIIANEIKAFKYERVYLISYIINSNHLQYFVVGDEFFYEIANIYLMRNIPDEQAINALINHAINHSISNIHIIDWLPFVINSSNKESEEFLDFIYSDYSDQSIKYKTDFQIIIFANILDYPNLIKYIDWEVISFTFPEYQVYQKMKVFISMNPDSCDISDEIDSNFETFSFNDLIENIEMIE